MIRRSEGGRLLLVITVLCADVGAYILSPSSFAQGEISQRLVFLVDLDKVEIVSGMK